MGVFKEQTVVMENSNRIFGYLYWHYPKF